MVWQPRSESGELLGMLTRFIIYIFVRVLRGELASAGYPFPPPSLSGVGEVECVWSMAG